MFIVKSNRGRLGLAALFVTAALASFVQSANALEGGKLSNEATLTLEQARAAALKAQPGSILDQELEHRAGGSGLRYSFDIESGGSTHEVAIDAKTGEILLNKTERSK